jgi:hypothetical protein
MTQIAVIDESETIEGEVAVGRDTNNGVWVASIAFDY